MNNYALISVYDKSNLPQLCRLFKKYKIKIISTGNTAKHIKKLGYSSMEISNITKFKEILDGRVKTLHPKIHASILFKRKNKKQSSFFKKLKVPEINFVIVNLYPFNKFIKSNTVIENCVDMIGKCSHGNDFVAAFQKNNMYGVQFHPEKSQIVGLQLIKNFIFLT